MPPTIPPGDLVYLYVDRNKSQVHDRYLATGVDGLWCNIKKFMGTQLRRTSYRVKLSDCYRVGGPNTASTSHDDNLESEDVNIPDDCPAFHCPPAIAEPPPVVSIGTILHEPEPSNNFNLSDFTKANSGTPVRSYALRGHDRKTVKARQNFFLCISLFYIFTITAT